MESLRGLPRMGRRWETVRVQWRQRNTMLREPWGVDMMGLVISKNRLGFAAVTSNPPNPSGLLKKT